ncbi:MAG TPA: hypothetical protein VG965_04425 [Patescibacteria group bacterium]|nr:hypothetical protein [Patescibacteria group bacterium]
MHERQENPPFDSRDTGTFTKGLGIARYDGEGVNVEGFGQVYLISHNHDRRFAFLGFQSVTDKYRIRFIRFSYGLAKYITSETGISGTIGVERHKAVSGLTEIVFNFPREVEILRQELTEGNVENMNPYG